MKRDGDTAPPKPRPPAWSAEGKAIRFDNNPEECEKVWTMYNKMCELDKEKGKQVKEYEG